jgi:hypothetical protein
MTKSCMELDFYFLYKFVILFQQLEVPYKHTSTHCYICMNNTGRQRFCTAYFSL